MKKVLYILGEFKDTDIEWILKTGEKKRIPPHEVIVEEGKPLDALYIILDGRFSVTLSKNDNKEIAVLSAGEVIGEISYVDCRPPSATVTATQPSIVLALQRDKIIQKLKQDIGFAARFYRALAVFLSDRLRGTISRLGYGESESLKEDIEYADELNDDILDNVSMAGSRFDDILSRLRGDI